MIVSQLNENSLTTWFAMALDYLPIQASALPSERIFSSSAQTDTACRNCIKHILMESLQMLKFGGLDYLTIFLCIDYCIGLKKGHLDFTHGWVTDETLMMEKEDLTEDVLGKFVMDDSDLVFDQLMEIWEIMMTTMLL